MATAQFSDFNFKLAVVNKLMYDGSRLKPRFDVYEFAKAYTARKIDIEEEGYSIIPEVKEHFERVEIPVEYLHDIEQLCQDGGDDIYLNLCPMWDGEDDIFNIRSADDAKQLPNLKKVTLFFDEDDAILKAFAERGITAEWL